MEKIHNYKMNIRLYKYYILFSTALFVWPIEVLFFKNRGMLYTDIMIVESIISITQLIMEIPSGVIADKIGYRKAVLTGIMTEILAMFVLISSDGLVGTYIYSIFLGIGLAMISGTDTALLYESHILLQEEQVYIQTIRQAGTLKMWGLAIVSVISGVLFNVNPNYPYIFSIVFLLIAFCIVLLFKEVKVCDKRKEDTIDLNCIKQTFLRESKIRWIILIALLFSFLFSDLNYLMQAYMVSLNVKINNFGIVFFICNVISAVSFKYSGKIEMALKQNTRLVMTVIIVVIFVCAGCFQNYYCLFLLCFTRVCVATVMPILNVTINRNIISASRATLLSVYNAIICIFMAAYDPIIGGLIDRLGIQRVYLIIGMIGVVLSLLLIIEKIKAKKEKIVEEVSDYEQKNRNSKFIL